MSSRIGVTAAMRLRGHCCTSEASVTAQNAGLICRFPWQVPGVSDGPRRIRVAEPATVVTRLATPPIGGATGPLWGQVGTPPGLRRDLLKRRLA